MKLLDRLGLGRPTTPPQRILDLPEWAQALMTSTLAPRQTDAEGSVRVWAIADAASTATITSQFTTDAAEYARRYANAAHFEDLFRKGLAGSGVRIADRPLILDLGSGSGANSVIPCLKLFKGANFIATDLSGELLEMLADYAAHERLSDRIVCIVMDAMGNHVAPARFDLVTGAAILHHLDEPERGVQAAARALKPGGHAIFFEPFNGWGLVRLAFERILAEAEFRGGLDPAVAAPLGAIARDVAARTDPDPKTFPYLDDKWLFSRNKMETMAKAAGFSRVQIVPHNDHPTFYRDLTDVTLQLGTGGTGLVLPGWAYDILDQFDDAMPAAAKRDLMVEGTVVLTK